MNVEVPSPDTYVTCPLWPAINPPLAHLPMVGDHCNERSHPAIPVWDSHRFTDNMRLAKELGCPGFLHRGILQKV